MIRKIARITVYALLIFILLFIVVNLLPTKRPDPLFTEAELNARGDLTPENGFFILLGFLEPRNINPQSKKIVDQYIQYYVKGDNLSRHNIFTRKREAILRITYEAYRHIDDWNFFKRVIRDQELILKDDKNKFLTNRIERLMNSKIMEDLFRPDTDTYPFFGTYGLADEYILRYNVRAFIEGLNGKWGNATEKILKMIDFGQKLSRNARTSIVFSDGSRISANALYFLSEILNRSAYNSDLYKLVIQRLMNYRVFNKGFKYCLVSFYYIALNSIDTIDPCLPGELDNGILNFLNATIFNLTFDANRSIREFNEYFLQVLGDMETPPYKRTEQARLIKEKNPFWWFVNYAGRLHTAELMRNSYLFYWENIHTVYRIFDFYRVIDWYYMHYAKNDLVIILAMLHNDRIPYDKVQLYLDSLRKIGFIDPFTGKAYLWDAKEKLLKSKGSTTKLIHRNSQDIHYSITE